jgi:hypothetical protein
MENIENRHQTTQFVAAIVNEENSRHAEQLATELSKQDQAFLDAVGEIYKVRDFVGSPEKILGNVKTKHGEIAEQVEIGIINAKSLLNSFGIRATSDAVSRTAPEDYLIDGIKVQSKFVNGIGKNLDHILDHMKKYKNFGRDGSYYHIPKNHYETIDKILKGEQLEGTTSRTAQKIQEKVQEIERMSGHPFSKTVKSASSNYEDVQIGKVNETLDRQEHELIKENKQIKERICDNAQPTLADFGHIAVKGAVIGGSICFATKLYAKYKQGKNVFNDELNPEDWQEIGLDTVKGATFSGISATAIYGLTNFAQMSAPLAGAFVSAGMEVASLVESLNRGEITADQFIELSLFACIDSAIVAAGATVGQAVIPIPVIGAFVGAIAGRIVADSCKQLLGQDTQLAQQVEQYYQQSLANIDQAYKVAVDNLIATYERLGNLAEAAFDSNLNIELRLQASIELAETYGVPDSKIIRNIDDLDYFMLS